MIAIELEEVLNQIHGGTFVTAAGAITLAAIGLIYAILAGDGFGLRIAAAAGVAMMWSAVIGRGIEIALEESDQNSGGDDGE